MQGQALDVTQHGKPVRARGVRDFLPRPQSPGGGQAGNDGAQRVIRHREKKKIVGGAGYLVGGQDRGLGKQAGGPLTGRGRNSRGGDNAMPGGLERGAQHGPDSPRADNAHCKTRRSAHIQIQSSKGVPVERKYAPP
ncbi:hypothetical protein Abr02nite_64700 [Paractinoplanes brasiliensis]|nr:hypothetical protein Abr02nite_64700 [Actinoplanes brasiliensis]